MKKRKNNVELPLLKSILKIRVTGFNQARILNRLKKEGVSLSHINLIGVKDLEFNIPKKHSKKTFAILQDMCYNYSIVGESGAKKILSSCLSHIGLIAGAVVFAALLGVASQMVWSIEIGGNFNLDSKLILRSISECGVKVGTFKRKVDTEKLTKELRKMEGIAESTVEVIGTKVIINVIEQKDFIPPVASGNGNQNQDQDNDQGAAEIKSLYDAEVTRISVKSGTAMVSVGNKIAAGSVLIKGERISSMGEVIENVTPRGSVFGKVAFSEKHIFSPTEQILERSGKKKTSTSLSLLGLTIGKAKKQSGDCVITEGKLTFIPIKVTRTTYYETKLVEQERDIDAYVDKLKGEALLNNVIKAGGSEIETVTTLTNMDGGLIMLNIYIVAEVLISA